MANEMMIMQKTLSVAGQVISSMGQYAKMNKCIRKQDALVLKEQLEFIKASCRARGIAELTRQCINEMELTLLKIQQKKLDGGMLEMCMGLFRLQYDKLHCLLQNYQSN